jgi:beta-ribofuranosylaminobenzene 5'-phosphate synthase
MKIIVNTPSRLHFGFIDLTGDLGRIYGSMGVAIDNPGIHLEMSTSNKLIASGHNSTFAKNLLKSLSKYFSSSLCCSVKICKTIPRHIGLGSGTQLALAIASAYTKLFEIEISIRELSKIIFRDKISGVGIGAFEKGGFIIDSGYRYNRLSRLIDNKEPPLILFGHQIPEDWLFLLAIPKEKKGLSGKTEKSIMKSLSNTSRKRTERITRLVLMKIIPALLEKDIQSFGDAISNVDILTGLSFKKFQNGIFHSKVVEDCVNYMKKEGAYGAGQSSWGPVVYGLVKGLNQAKDLRQSVFDFLKKRGGGQVNYVNVRNRGANFQKIN